MKKILCLTLALLFCFSSVLTVSAEEVKWLAKPQFEEIYGSNEDGSIILAKNNGKYGYIDKNGKVLLDFIYDYATIFSKDMAYVEKDRVCYYINKNGKVLFELNAKNYVNKVENLNENDFIYGSAFSGDYALVTINDVYESFIIDRSGNYVSVPDGIWIEETDIYNNIAHIRKEASTEIGYLNIKTGKTVFSPYGAYIFKDGYGILQYKDGTIAVVNENLDFVSPSIYIGNAFVSISEDLIYVEDYADDGSPLFNNFYIDFSGNTIVKKNNYVALGRYSDGLMAAIIEENGVRKLGYINLNGKWVINPRAASAYSDFFKGIAVLNEVLEDNKAYETGFGIIDKTGKYIVQPQFQDFNNDEHYTYAKINNLWGILDIDALKTTTPNVSTDTPDTWAVDEVTKAINNKLVPSTMQNRYKEKITRKDFCELAISLIESKSGKSIDEYLNSKGLTIGNNVFNDTNDKNILAANALSIVNGKGNGLFDPNGFITRQEAAIMLAKTAKALGIDTSSSEVKFADSNLIASWAKNEVNYVASKNVMNGTNKGFEPTANYTRQQAYITIYRLFEAIK